MTEPTVHVIGECTVRIFPDWMETVFKDGLSVPAAANDDPDSLERAAALGYSSTWEMSKSHEIAHSLLMVALGHEFSPVLRGVAVRESGGNKDDIVAPKLSNLEEALVMDFQRFVQTGVASSYLLAYKRTYGLDLDALAAELRRLTA